MGLMKKLTSAVVASSLVLGLVGTAAAAPSSAQLNDAYARLNAYSVVQGKTQKDGTVSPALGDALTRAELTTVLARGFGQEETAKLLKGATSFKDVPAAEWYSGYVALIKNVAEQKGTTIGYEDGTFRPNAQVKAIEALAFIMKLLGVKPATGANWVADTIKVAQAAGVITAADVAAYLDAPEAAATRGLAFALADAIFRTYQVTPGKTVYTTYVDTTAPVLTVKQPAAPTTTAAAAEITGSVQGATALFLGSEKLTVNTDGTFSVKVDLKVGDAKANTFTFSAVDLAGNVTTVTYAVARTPGVAKSVTAKLDATTLAVDGTAKLTVTVLDENKVELKADADLLKVTVAGGIGTEKDGVFTAGTVAGKGTINVTYGDLKADAIDVTVNAGEINKVVASKTSIDKAEKVTLTAQDKYGNTITGATFAAESADAFINGNVFTAVATGTYKVTGTAAGKTATANIGVFGAVNAVKLALSSSTLVANGSTEIVVTATVVDANGNTVANAGNTATLTGTAGLTIAKDGDIVNGVQKFKVKTNGAVAGQQITLTGSHSDKTGTATVDIVAQVASGVKLATKPGTYVATNSNAGVAIAAEVVDQAGVKMATGAWNVAFAVTGSATLTAADGGAPGTATTLAVDYANGAAAAAKLWALQGATGAITVTAKVEGLGQDVATTTAAIAGNPAKLSITASKTSAKAANGESIVYTVNVTDANGVPVALHATQAQNLTVKLGVANAATAAKLFFKAGEVANGAFDNTVTEASPGTDAAVLNNTLSLAANATSVKFSIGAYNFVGDVPVSVEYSGLTTASNTVNFKAGDAATVVLDQNSKTLDVALNNTAFTVSGMVTDAAGNTVALAGHKVKLAARNTADNANENRVNINGTAQVATVTTDAAGKFTANVTTQTYPDLAFIVKLVDADTTNDTIAVESHKVTATVKAAVASSVEIVSVKNTANTPVSVASIAAGEEVVVTVLVKDQYGNPLNVGTTPANVPLKMVFTSGQAFSGNTDVTTAGLDNPTGATEGETGKVTFTFKPTVVPSTGFKVVAKNTVGTVESATALVGVTPATVTAETISVKLVRATTATVVEPTKDAISGPYTISLTDKYGNAVAAPAKIKVLISTNGLEDSEYLYVRESSSAGAANVSFIEINAGYTSKTVYLLTNATDANSDATADVLRLSVDHPTADDVIDDTITVKAK